MRPADQGGSTDLYFGDDYNYFKLPGNYGAGTLGVDIGANDGASGAQHVWRFGTDGTLELPNGGTIVDENGNNVIPTVPTSVSQLTNDSGFIAMVAVPASSLGAPGDEPGKVAFDAGYIYYCTTFYDGVANIWKRVAWSVDTW
jgi:hypothetical protein